MSLRALPLGPLPADTPAAVGPTGLLERIQYLLNNAGPAIDALSSKAWSGVVAKRPDLADPTKTLTLRSVELADSTTNALLEGMLAFGKNNAYQTPSWQRFEEGLRSYWQIETDPRTGERYPVKSEGGGVAYLAKAISKIPEVKTAADAAIAKLGPTKLLNSLNETHKLLVLLAGVAAYGTQIVRFTSDGLDVRIPGVGGFSVVDGKVRDAALDLRQNLAKIGPRGRSVAMRMSASAFTSDGDKVNAGIAVPVARRATFDVSASAVHAPRSRPTGEVVVSYKTYVAPTSDVALKATAAQRLAVSPGGRIEPKGDRRISVELTGPLPELNRRLRDNRTPSKTATDAEKDGLAMAAIRAGKKVNGKVPLYTELMRMDVDTLRRIAAS